MAQVNYILTELTGFTSSITGNVGQTPSDIGQFELTKIFVPNPGFEVKPSYFTINGYAPNEEINDANDGSTCERVWYNDQADNPGINLHEAIYKIKIAKACNNADPGSVLSGQVWISVSLKEDYELTSQLGDQLLLTIDIDGDAQPILNTNTNGSNIVDNTINTEGLETNKFTIEVKMENEADSNCSVVFLPVATNLNVSGYWPQTPTEEDFVYEENSSSWRQLIAFRKYGDAPLGSQRLGGGVYDGLMGFFIVPNEGYTLSKNNLSIKTSLNGSPLNNPSVSETSNFDNAEDLQTGEEYYDINPMSASTGWRILNQFDNIVKLGHNGGILSGDFFRPYVNGFGSLNSLIDFWNSDDNDLSFIQNSDFIDNIKWRNGYSTIEDETEWRQYFAATTYVNPIAEWFVDTEYNGTFPGWWYAPEPAGSVGSFQDTAGNAYMFEWQGVNLSDLGGRNKHMYNQGYVRNNIPSGWDHLSSFTSGFHKDNMLGSSVSGSPVSFAYNEYNFEKINQGTYAGQYFEMQPWSISLVDIATGKNSASHQQVIEGQELSPDVGGPFGLGNQFPLYPSFFSYDWRYGIFVNDPDNESANDGGFPYVSNTGVIPDQYCASDFEGNFVAVILSNMGGYTPGTMPPHIKISIEGSAMPVDGSECVNYDVIIESD